MESALSGGGLGSLDLHLYFRRMKDNIDYTCVYFVRTVSVVEMVGRGNQGWDRRLGSPGCFEVRGRENNVFSP